MPPEREAQERTNIANLGKPRRVIDQRDKAQRNDRPNAGDGHQPAGDGLSRCFFFHGTIDVRSGLAKSGMGSDEPVGDSAQHRISLSRSSELVAKALPLPTFPYTGQTDPDVT